MSLFDSASLVVTPNGYKAGKLYSIKPSDGAGDLDVVRATSATRVNSLGLIESVGNNVARLDYSNGSCPSILVEPQRTNLLLRSQEFDDAAWTKLDTTITANSIASPSGVQDADKIEENTNNSFHLIEQIYATTIGTNYALSFYVKKAERNFVVLGVFTNESKQIRVNLTTGTILSTAGTWVSTRIEDVGNDWYRVTGVFTADVLAYVFCGPDLNGNANPYTGTTGSGIYIYGAQLEAGEYATSYIPTVASAVTRNADVISKTGISSLIGQTEGTIFTEIDWINTNSDVVFNTISDNTTNNRLHFGYAQSTNIWYLYIESGGSPQVNITLAAPANGRYKIAVGYKANDFVFYINGSLVGSDTSGNVPITSQLNLGGFITSGLQYSNKITALWKTRLSNAQLAELTTL